MNQSIVAAVDLGASGGRVLTGRVGPGTLQVVHTARFPNVAVQVGPTLHWDVLSLYRDIVDGLRQAGAPDSIGVDSWGVDYGLLDTDGRLLGNPVHYRDHRTDGVMDSVLHQVSPAQLYAVTGLQLLPFNTIFQLAACRGSAQLQAAHTMLLIPDLITYWLTGQIGAERTNASTTQLLDVTTGRWANGLAAELGIPAGILPPLREPGEHIGVWEGTAVTAVGSHDTASAVVGVPARGERFAYISCGTWSLVGVELDSPVLSEESRKANFTNEVGVDGTIRYLRNVMGLWLLQECQRLWAAEDVEALLREAAQAQPFRSVIDPNDPSFLPHGHMPTRIVDACRKAAQPIPETRAEIVRCIMDSLALAHRDTLAQAQQLSGREVDVVHIVGGGARNDLLCQLTADACGLPVVAGPVEATAIGNILIQARALGSVGSTLTDMRALIRATQPIRRYEPQGRN